MVEQQEARPAYPLRQLTEQVRDQTGLKGAPPLMDDWEKRRKSGEKITEAQSLKRIADLEREMEKLQYGPLAERSMYLAILERMRLRMDVITHGKGKFPDQVDLHDPQTKADIETLQGLDKRITYAQYEQAAIHDIVDVLERYEAHRTKFKLDGSDAGLVPRNTELEHAVHRQLSELTALLPRLADVRKLRYFEELQRRSPTPERGKTVASLRATLPPEARAISLDEYYLQLSQTLRKQLGETSPGMAPEKLTTPLAHELYVDLLRRHFDSVLQRREALIGSTNPGSSQRKRALAQEHVDLLGEAVGYQMSSVGRRVTIGSLLVLSGHIGAPYAGDATQKPDRDYGPLKNDALKQERSRSLDALKDYVAFFRSGVLREGRTAGAALKNVPIIGRLSNRMPVLQNTPYDPEKIIEDILTTHTIPLKIQLADPLARGATAPWAVHDYLWSKIGIDFGIHDKRTRQILAPIYERLGLPENYGELSPEQQAEARNSPKVKERIQSVRKIIDDFKQTNDGILRDLEGDVATIEKLLKRKEPDQLILTGPPIMPASLPDNVDALKTDEEIVGAYIAVLDGMTGPRIDALGAAEREFILKLNQNMGLNIDISDVEHQLASAYIRELAFAAIALLAEALGGYLTLRIGVPLMIRKGIPLAWRGTKAGMQAGVELGQQAVRGTARGVRATEQALKGLRSSTSPATLSPATESAALKTARELSPAAKALGGVLVGGDLALNTWELMDAQQRVQALREARESFTKELDETLLARGYTKEMKGEFPQYRHTESNAVIDTENLYAQNGTLLYLAKEQRAVAGGSIAATLTAMTVAGVSAYSSLAATATLGATVSAVAGASVVAGGMAVAAPAGPLLILYLDRKHREAKAVHAFMRDCPSDLFLLMNVEKAINTALPDAMQSIESLPWHAYAPTSTPERGLAKEKIAKIMLARSMNALSPLPLSLHWEHNDTQLTGMFGALPDDVFREEEVKKLFHPDGDMGEVLQKAAERILRVYLVQGYMQLHDELLRQESLDATLQKIEAGKDQDFRFTPAEIEAIKKSILLPAERKRLKDLVDLIGNHPFLAGKTIAKTLSDADSLSPPSGSKAPSVNLQAELQQARGRGEQSVGIRVNPGLFLASALNEPPVSPGSSKKKP